MKFLKKHIAQRCLFSTLRRLCHIQPSFACSPREVPFITTASKDDNTDFYRVRSDEVSRKDERLR
jgi:hypothetical protein